jgi:stage III sporulation protein AB
MWMKVIGIICILVSGMMWGFIRASKYRNRTKQIRALKFAIKRLETEINYSLTPLRLGLYKIAASCDFPIQELFETASSSMENQHLDVNQAWRMAIVQVWPKLDLKQQEKDLLVQFGTTLGISNRDDQVKHIQLIMQQLSLLEEHALTDQSKHEQSSKSIGIMLAILIVLLFV